MINRFEFYKEFYFKELDKKNEINGSLSQPIGLITAFVAAIFYLVTNFNYKYSFSLTLIFVITISGAIFFLAISVYHLVKAYNDFPRGYNYAIIADTNDIDNYYQQLKAYYAAHSSTPDTSDQDLEDYILEEMIRNTGDNQKNNKRKNKFSYNCEKNLIIVLMITCLSLITFSLNYYLKPANKAPEEVKLVNPESIKINLNSKENLNFVREFLKDSTNDKRTSH